MKVAIMQPYFMPYIGYFQLINAVDAFVVYDNIEYTKKGWVNRNRILVNGKDEYITLPLKKDSDFLNVNQRFLSVNFKEEKIKVLRKLKEVYRNAPYFEEVFFLINEVFSFEDDNLFNFIFNSLTKCCEFMGIRTNFIKSSSININHELRSQDKVIAINKALGSNEYINPIGGVELYSVSEFHEFGINLKFIKSSEIIYSQFGNDFVPWLSIIDILMFNTQEEIKVLLNKYELQ